MSKKYYIEEKWNHNNVIAYIVREGDMENPGKIRGRFPINGSHDESDAEDDADLFADALNAKERDRALSESDKANVTAPLVHIKLSDSEWIKLWFIRPGQQLRLGDHKSMQFPHCCEDTTPSFVYERQSVSSHEAIEKDVFDRGIWDWIKRYMEAGTQIVIAEDRK